MALLLPVSTPRAVACGDSWGCCGGGGRPRPRRPLVVVVVAELREVGRARRSVVFPLPVVVFVVVVGSVLVSSPGITAPRLHPASSCIGITGNNGPEDVEAH